LHPSEQNFALLPIIRLLSQHFAAWQVWAHERWLIAGIATRPPAPLCQLRPFSSHQRSPLYSA